MPTFLVLLLAYTLSQFFRSFLAVIAPELSHELSLSPADLGNISAIWFWAFALAQLYVGWSLDRIGPRRTMAGMMVLAVAGAAVFASARGFYSCMLGMALIGLGCAPIYMGSLFLFARGPRKDRFALLSSLLLGFGSAGNLLGTTPLAVASQWIGWRIAFAGIALATAIAAALIGWVLRDPERVQHPTRQQGAIAGLVEILSLRALWPFFPIALLSYAVLLAERGLWVGPFLANVHGLDVVPRGNAVLVMAAAMSLGALAYGPADQLGVSRKAIVAAGSLVTGLLFVVLSIWGAHSVFIATLLLALIGAAGMTYVQLMAHARQFLPEELLGRGLSTMNLLLFGGAGMLQPLSGALVARMQAAGASAASTYGDLHLAFGLLLLGATAVYLAARR